MSVALVFVGLVSLPLLLSGVGVLIERSCEFRHGLAEIDERLAEPLAGAREQLQAEPVTPRDLPSYGDTEALAAVELASRVRGLPAGVAGARIGNRHETAADLLTRLYAERGETWAPSGDGGVHFTTPGTDAQQPLLRALRTPTQEFGLIVSSTWSTGEIATLSKEWWCTTCSDQTPQAHVDCNGCACPCTTAVAV